MSRWLTLRSWLRTITRRSRVEGEIDDELRFHVEEEIEAAVGAGMTPEDARRAAYASLGGPPVIVREACRDQRGVSLVEDFLRDLAHGARFLRRNRTFALMSVLTLAIGIGATTTIFGLVNEILLRSLPYPEADRIVMIRFTPPNQSDQKLGTNRGTFRFIREHSRSFDHIGELRITGMGVAPGSGAEATREWVRAALTGFGVTEVMGVQPMPGRWFGPADTQQDVVISHRLWQRMFGGAAGVLSQTLRIEFREFTIIGVMPRTYRTLDSDVDLWLLQPDDSTGAVLRSPNRLFNIFARLKPGVTIDQARAEMDALAGPLGDDMEMHRGWGIAVDSLRDAYVGYLKAPVLVLQVGSSCCCSSPVPTSPVCCWRRARRVRRSSPHDPPSARPAAGRSGSSSRKTCCSRSAAA